MNGFDTVCWIIWLNFALAPVKAAYPEGRLIGDLLSKYNKASLPAKSPQHTVIVRISLDLINIKNLHEKTQELEIFVYLGMRWVDGRLSWRPDLYEGVTTISIPATDLWVPDIAIENAAAGVYDGPFDIRFRTSIDQSGLVTWIPSGPIKTTCPLAMRYFPFDVQRCEIRFSNWMYTAERVALTNSSPPTNMQYYVESSEWRLIRIAHEQRNVTYPGPTVYGLLSYFITLERRSAYYMVSIVVPVMMISLMALLMFVLPSNSGEKIGLGITVLLSFSVFLILVSDQIPVTTDTPLLSIYLNSAMCLCGTSIVMTSLVLTIHHRSGRYKVPLWLKKFTLGFLINVVCAKKYLKTSKVSPILKQKNELKLLDVNDIHNTVSVISKNYNQSEKSGEVPDLLRILNSNLEEIKEKVIGDEDEEETREEWMLIAKVFDRFFMLCFFTATVLTSVAILGFLPLSRPQP